jgi:hypothetical protein
VGQKEVSLWYGGKNRRNLKDQNHCSYRGGVKSQARRTSRCILFDGENISFDASLVIYIYIYIYIYIWY